MSYRIKFFKQEKLSKFLVLALLLIMILGCRAQDQNLLFDSIEISEWSPGYKEKDANLIMVKNSDEINFLENLVSADALNQLRNIDFDNCFVISVFGGWGPTGYHGFFIEEITRGNSTISIYAPKGRASGEDIESSPYHVAKICKDESWGENYVFKLIIDDDVVVTETYFIP